MLAASPVATVYDMAMLVRTATSDAWMQRGERRAIALFSHAARYVPAYRGFLARQGIDPRHVQTREDFEKLPTTSKATYLTEFPLAELCWNGTLARPGVFSSTSGSTGKPFYFQRQANLEEQSSVLAELFLGNAAKPPGLDNPTLVIVGFAMGVWIGGTITYQAFDIASRRAYPVSILATGINKREILTALRDLAPNFTQTILIGYPPFIKDVIDEAEGEGIDLRALNIRLMFAAECFTETFRDYLAEKVGISNVYRDTLNVYGTADIGTMAFETPTSILIRRLANQDAKLYKRLFHDERKTPTLAQYNPDYTMFEAPGGEILVTGDSAVPLIRYRIGDRGGVYTYGELVALFSESGIDLESEARRRDVPIYELPFVYVYERADLSTTLYGMQIYPEYLRDVLVSTPLRNYCTGKFQIITTYGESMNQYLDIKIEKKRRVGSIAQSIVKMAEELMFAALRGSSSEFSELSEQLADRQFIRVNFREHGDPVYFCADAKHKWVRSGGVSQI
jgi:phenylacetate-CoA ligase